MRNTRKLPASCQSVCGIMTRHVPSSTNHHKNRINPTWDKQRWDMYIANTAAFDDNFHYINKMPSSSTLSRRLRCFLILPSLVLQSFLMSIIDLYGSPMNFLLIKNKMAWSPSDIMSYIWEIYLTLSGRRRKSENCFQHTSYHKKNFSFKTIKFHGVSVLQYKKDFQGLMKFHRSQHGKEMSQCNKPEWTSNFIFSKYSK